MNLYSINKPDIFNPMSMFNNIGMEVEYIIEQHALDKKELLDILQWEDFHSKSRISKKDIKSISKYIGLGEEFEIFLSNFQKDYIEKENEINKSLKETKKIYSRVKHLLGWEKDDYNDGIDKLEDIIDFLDAEDEECILNFSINVQANYKKSLCHGIDDINLMAWLRRGELDFHKIDLSSFNIENLTKWIELMEWDKNISNLTYFYNLPSIFKEFGVALIFTPYLPKTVYGAARWIDGKPLVQISDKGHDVASCWFTLFHEIGHIILHQNENFLDDNLNDKPSKKEISQQEKEANKFANKYLFNGDSLRKEIFALTRSNQRCHSKALAEKHRVNQLFVDFWCRKAQNYPIERSYTQIKFEL